MHREHAIHFFVQPMSTAQVTFLVLGVYSIVWRSPLYIKHFWYASVPDAQVQVALAWALFTVLSLPDGRKSSIKVGVETIGASDVGSCRELGQNECTCANVCRRFSHNTTAIPHCANQPETPNVWRTKTKKLGSCAQAPNKFQCPDDVKRNEKSQSHISWYIHNINQT